MAWETSRGSVGLDEICSRSWRREVYEATIRYGERGRRGEEEETMVRVRVKTAPIPC